MKLCCQNVNINNRESKQISTFLCLDGMMHLAFFVDRVNFFNAMQQMIKNNIYNNTNKQKTFIFKFLGYNIIVHLRNVRNT